MNNNILKLAAKKYYNIGKQTQEELNDTQDVNMQSALRMVCGQNYFYAFVSAIDAKLMVKNIRSKDHRDRRRLITLNASLFKDAQSLDRMYEILMGNELNYRIKVAYRGENGTKFERLKEAGEIAMQEIKDES